MTRIPFSSRPPRGPQTEVCDLCQRLVNADDLIEVDVEGLRGYTVCRHHGVLATEPSFTDLRGLSNRLSEAVLASVREPPFGDEVWWDADGDGYLMKEDSVTAIRQEDDRRGIRLEHVP